MAQWLVSVVDEETPDYLGRHGGLVDGTVSQGSQIHEYKHKRHTRYYRGITVKPSRLTQTRMLPCYSFVVG